MKLQNMTRSIKPSYFFFSVVCKLDCWYWEWLWKTNL